LIISNPILAQDSTKVDKRVAIFDYRYNSILNEGHKVGILGITGELTWLGGAGFIGVGLSYQLEKENTLPNSELVEVDEEYMRENVPRYRACYTIGFLALPLGFLLMLIDKRITKKKINLNTSNSTS